MAVITLDRFELGIDLRKGDSVSDANRLRDLANAYVTNGWAIQKRPGLRFIIPLTSGSHGLLSFDNALHTFSARPLTHVENDEIAVLNHVVINPDNVVLQVDRVLYSDVFNGAIYVVVRYTDGSIKHHYLLEYDSWVFSTAYALDDVISGDSKGHEGVYYHCIKAGTSGVSEPDWPYIYSKPSVWESVSPVDDHQLVRPVDGTGVWKAEAAGTTGANEPAWVLGADILDNDVNWIWHQYSNVVVDGSVEWEPISTAVGDENCPHTGSALVLGSKIYSVDDDIVRFSATDDPMDWTTADDAGFLPTGVRSPGSPTALALGDFQGDLVVFMDDSIQVWAIDPDPQRDALRQVIGNVGTHYPKSVRKVGDDLYFLADVGFRSIAQQKYTTNLEDVDVGTAVDPLIRPLINGRPDIDIQAHYYAGGGQYVCAIGKRVFVYSFSRTSKVSAWSYYDFKTEVEAMETLADRLYIRSHNNIYHADENYYLDHGETFKVSGRMAYQSFKKPGIMKQIFGVDVVLEGEAQVSHLYDARDEEAKTMGIRMTGDSRPAPLTPVEVMTTEVAFEFENETEDDFRLDSISYHYHLLDSV